MDNKDMKNSDHFNDPNNWKSLGFFSAEDYLIYIFKKTEKITSALYLVSALLNDEEPIKWELRDRGVDLLSASFTASSILPGDKNSVIQAIFTSALETISLLNVARISKLISEMNHNLLVHEIDQVVGLLRDRLAESAESAGYVLSESFFKTPDLFSTGFSNNVRASSSFSSLQSNSNKVSNTKKSLTDQSVLKGHVEVQQNKSKRQETIISILKGQSNLTIKDFSRVIKDCSEKTIQRELLELVDKGLIKKEGERRWSKYSLK